MALVNKLNCRIAGAAGAGVAVMGLTLSRALKASGLNVFTYNDYPSLIKGGHNMITIRADSDKVFCQSHDLDLVLALNKEGVMLHQHLLTSNGAIIYDGEKIVLTDEEKKRSDIKFISVPMLSIATNAGNPIYLNTVGMGTLFGFLDMDLEVLNSLLRKAFANKGEQVISKNIEVAKLGFDYVKQNYKEPFKIKIEKQALKKDVLISGNDAVCVGAIKGGVKFVGEYPMSPSSSVLHFMAAHEREFGLIVKHTEDEISAINMIIGASFAGVRSMTATSGGGFSLMVEGLGLAGLSETPIVILEVQRCGPATGLPTYTEQSDLIFAINASQGEFPLVVVAPGDVQECFDYGFEAFNIAERVQTPVIILSDKYLGEATCTLPRFDDSKLRVDRGKIASDEQMSKAVNFKRHELTSDGVSTRCFPGQKNGMHVCSSYEHDETGFSNENPLNRINQINKRAKKLELITEGELAPKIIGDSTANTTIVCWGSTKMPAQEALKILKAEGIKAKIMQPIFLNPFPAKKVKQVLESSKHVLLVEGNSTGQLGRLIREQTGLSIEHSYLKYDGRPLEGIDIANHVKKIVGGRK